MLETPLRLDRSVGPPAAPFLPADASVLGRRKSPLGRRKSYRSSESETHRSCWKLDCARLSGRCVASQTRSDPRATHSARFRTRCRRSPSRSARRHDGRSALRDDASGARGTPIRTSGDAPASAHGPSPRRDAASAPAATGHLGPTIGPVAVTTQTGDAATHPPARHLARRRDDPDRRRDDPDPPARHLARRRGDPGRRATTQTGGAATPSPGSTPRPPGARRRPPGATRRGTPRQATPLYALPPARPACRPPALPPRARRPGRPERSEPRQPPTRVGNSGSRSPRTVQLSEGRATQARHPERSAGTCSNGFDTRCSRSLAPLGMTEIRVRRATPDAAIHPWRVHALVVACRAARAAPSGAVRATRVEAPLHRSPPHRRPRRSPPRRSRPPRGRPHRRRRRSGPRPRRLHDRGQLAPHPAGHRRH